MEQKRVQRPVQDTGAGAPVKKPRGRPKKQTAMITDAGAAPKEGMGKAKKTGRPNNTNADTETESEDQAMPKTKKWTKPLAKPAEAEGDHNVALAPTSQQIVPKPKWSGPAPRPLTKPKPAGAKVGDVPVETTAKPSQLPSKLAGENQLKGGDSMDVDEEEESQEVDNNIIEESQNINDDDFEESQDVEKMGYLYEAHYLNGSRMAYVDPITPAPRPRGKLSKRLAVVMDTESEQDEPAPKHKAGNGTNAKGDDDDDDNVQSKDGKDSGPEDQAAPPRVSKRSREALNVRHCFSCWVF